MTCRQREEEGGAGPAIGAVEADEFTAVCTGESSGDRQTETGTAAVVAVHETLEDPLSVLWWNTWTVVLNNNLDDGVVVDQDLYLTRSCGGVAGVVEEVGEDLGQAVGVGVQGHGRAGDA